MPNHHNSHNESVEVDPDHKPQPKKASFCQKFDRWFWGQYKPYIYSEQRLYMNYWFIQIFRILFTLALYGNTIYRFYYNIRDGELLHSQFYFTTFGIYITLYTETAIIITSFWTRKQGYDENRRHMVNWWKHNNLMMSVALGCEAVITVVYWFGIAFVTSIGDEVVSSSLDHSLPVFILIGDFIMVGWIFRYTYYIVFFIVAFGYMPINYAYVKETNNPIYENIAWRTYKSYVYVLAILIVGIILYFILTLVSRKRYSRYVRQNVELAKEMDPNESGSLKNSKNPDLETGRDAKPTQAAGDKSPIIPSER